MATADEPRSVGGMARRANPAFAGGAVALPVLALAGALAWGDLRALTYVHVMAAVLWTGIDLFVGLVLGPVLGGLSEEARADVFRRFTPKMTFLMPTLALVTITGGVVLAVRLGYFPTPEPWLAVLSAATTLPAVALIAAQFDRLRDRRTVGLLCVLAVGHAAWLVTAPQFGPIAPAIAAALGIVAVLSVVGFGVILPGEVRVYLETAAADPDEELIAAIGLRNARLGGLQGLLQLTIVLDMVLIRWGIGLPG